MAVTIFRIKASNIREKRWDAQAYEDLGTLNQPSKYPYTTLEDSIILSKTNWNQRSIYDNTFPYIQISNIDTVSGAIYDIDYPLVKNAPSRAKQITCTNDIIVSATRPYRGGIAYITDKENQFIASTGFFIIRNIKDNIKINKKYLFYTLKREKTLLQMKRKSSGGNYPAITKENFLTLLIPLPPMDIQQEIADIMDHAYSKKKLLETEAKELLDSIDSYIMDKLGIEQIEQSKATNKWFTVKASDIRGNRWDPVSISLQEYKNSSHKYEMNVLTSVVNIIKGQMITANSKEEGTIPVIAGGQKPAYYHSLANFNEDTITISASGAYAGYIWYHNYPIWASDCNVLTIKNGVEVDFLYVFNYLKSIQYFIYKLQTGSAQPHVYKDDIAEIQIPLPPMDIQQEIALECETRRNTAQQNQKLAQDILAKAKANVEKILFGE